MEDSGVSDLKKGISNTQLVTDQVEISNVQKSNGKRESELTEVTYDIVQQSHYPPTRALFLGNLNSLFENSHLQGMLEDNVSESGSFIERAWLNRKRTHSIVVVSDIKGAELLRDKLNGKPFPVIDENIGDTTSADDSPGKPIRKRLYIDYIPVKVVQTWITQEDNGPGDALWKIEYETIRERVIAKHTMINYPSVETSSIDKRGRNNDRYNRDNHYQREYRYRNGRFDDYRHLRGGRSSYYDHGRGRSFHRSSTDRLLSSSYVPGTESKESADSTEHQYKRSFKSYGETYNRGYDRGGYYARPAGYYNQRYRDRENEGYQSRHYQRDEERSGYRSYRSLRDRSEESQDNKSKTDDRDRSRSPVRPSDMDWDLDGES